MLPTGLSMLWEQVEPRAALRERFGFDDLDAVTAWLTEQLARGWGIAATGVARVVISDHNAIAWVSGDRGDLVVKWSHAQRLFASLDASTRLLRTLHDGGVPVACPLRTTDGLDRAVVEGPVGPLSVTVLPELTGRWLDVSDDVAVRAAGAALAHVHRVLAGTEPSAPDPGEGLRERIGRWLADGDRGFAPAASERLRALVDRLPDLDDRRQLVHDDFRAANVLTCDSAVVGVLDLDEVRVGHRVDDLAKASTYLATLFTGWGPTPAAVRRTFVEGYESVRPLGADESRWFEALVLWHGIMAIPHQDDAAGWASAVG